MRSEGAATEIGQPYAIAEGEVRLPDGRGLAWAEYGDPRGAPVIYCHGFPGSRSQAGLAHADAARLGIRMIGIDRPGIGRSHAAPGRRLVDWPADVSGVADALGLGRFAVLGLSGGGPYAAACARLIPKRLIAVAIVSGLGPPESWPEARAMRWVARVGLRLAAAFPAVAGAVFGATARGIVRDADRMLALVERSYSAPDRAVLMRPEVRRLILASFREGVRQGGTYLAQDLALLARPWGFRLEEVEIPVDLWHGEVDNVVPPGMGRHVAARIPACRAHFLPGEGHFSLAIDHTAAILSTLMASRRAPEPGRPS